MTNTERLTEIQTELESAAQHLPNILRALAPAMAIGQLVALKNLGDRIQEAIGEAYVQKFPHPTPRIETREESERLR